MEFSGEYLRCLSFALAPLSTGNISFRCSMDGDIAPLQEICDLADAYDAEVD